MQPIAQPGLVESIAADSERRFGGLRRLYGDASYETVRALRLAVVGLGGVGSWTVEALARCGVAELVLVDLDQVAESNINRQVQALTSTLGAAKVEALRARVHEIHPDCVVHCVEEFVDENNWPALLSLRAHLLPIDGLIDACDQVRAKATLAAWARREQIPFVTVGAAGGKQRPQDVQVEDLGALTHDPLLASLRYQLRRKHGLPRAGQMNVQCVYSREAVGTPEQSCSADGSLNCHGYGSSVMVTSTFGMVAAAQLLQEIFGKSLAKRKKIPL